MESNYTEPKYGKRIRDVRKAFGLTQEQFAKKCGISLTSLRRYEANERQPNIAVLENMAAHIGLTIQDFFWKDFQHTVSTPYSQALSRLLQTAFDQLNDEGQQKALERVEELTEIPKYKKEQPQD